MRQKVIGVQGVSKTYKTVKAVRDVSFSVEKGTCFGFLGPNGAGKTTLMKIIYGKTLRDTSRNSKVDIFGFDPVKEELEIKFISGIVPQDDNLDVELTVLQNLLIYSRFYGIPKSEALERIGSLLAFMELQDKSGSRIKELSGGMRRRLIIARALINSPSILILDEPTTGLDPQVRHLIWDKLRNLKQNGVTILLTTHYMEEAFQLCDRLMIMHQGESILEGRPSDLVRDNIEEYVLEIYNPQCGEPADSADYRMEKTNSRIMLYSSSLSVLEKMTEKFCTGEFYLRQSNLEDLFLKVTGRNLNE